MCTEVQSFTVSLIYLLIQLIYLTVWQAVSWVGIRAMHFKSSGLYPPLSGYVKSVRSLIYLQIYLIYLTGNLPGRHKDSVLQIDYSYYIVLFAARCTFSLLLEYSQSQRVDHYQCCVHSSSDYRSINFDLPDRQFPGQVQEQCSPSWPVCLSFRWVWQNWPLWASSHWAGLGNTFPGSLLMMAAVLWTETSISTNIVLGAGNTDNKP